MNQINWWKTKFSNDLFDSLKSTIDNKRISQGKTNLKLEKKLSKLLKCKYVITVPSGTSALTLALFSLGIKPGDEVLVPNRTWVATAHSAFVIGAKIKLIDVKKNIPIIDENQIIKNISKKTKAIVCVHLNGRACDIDTLKKIAKKYKLFLIEDAAQAMFSKYKNKFLGTQSDVGCFSLGLTKLISSGQGGFITTNSNKLYKKISLVKNHGVVDNFTEKWNQPGFNFKFTDILATLALSQLNELSHRIKRCKKIYNYYDVNLLKLKKIKLIPVKVIENELPIYIEAICDNKQKLIKFMKEKKVQIRPLPPSLSNSFYLNQKRKIYRNSKIFEKRAVYLPSGPDQPINNIKKVCQLLIEYEKL